MFRKPATRKHSVLIELLPQFSYSKDFHLGKFRMSWTWQSKIRSQFPLENAISGPPAPLLVYTEHFRVGDFRIFWPIGLFDATKFLQLLTFATEKANWVKRSIPPFIFKCKTAFYFQHPNWMRIIEHFLIHVFNYPSAASSSPFRIFIVVFHFVRRHTLRVYSRGAEMFLEYSLQRNVVRQHYCDQISCDGAHISFNHLRNHCQTVVNHSPTAASFNLWRQTTGVPRAWLGTVSKFRQDFLPKYGQSSSL